MNQVPVPELLVGAAITLVIMGLRALWRVVQGESVHQSVAAGQLRQDETDQKRARLLASCVLFAVISIPLILKAVPPNGLYGFRVRATLTNPAIWYAANAFGGWALLFAAVMSATALLLLPAGVKRWQLWATFLLPIVGALAASLAYLERLG